jgi:uncharacterized iron-regulated membrane protein
LPGIIRSKEENSVLDALSTLPVALTSNPSGWSKALEILIIAIGILALIVTVYLMWKHKVFSAQPDAAEEGVIRTGATSTTTGALFAFLSVMGLPLSMAGVRFRGVYDKFV